MDGRGKRQNLGSREGEKKVNRKSSRWEKGRRGEGEEERKKKRDEGEEDGDVKELKKLEWWCFALSGENPSMKICLFFLDFSFIFLYSTLLSILYYLVLSTSSLLISLEYHFLHLVRFK